MPHFGKYIAKEFWSPEYGEIDWKQRRDLMMDSDELKIYLPVGFDSEDGLVQEVTQENTSIFTNRVAPDMDMIAHLDHRDGLEYLWFRDAEPDFEKLAKQLGRAALVHFSEYPLETVVGAYLRRRERDWE